MSDDSLKIENKDKDNIDISEIHDIQVENEFDNCRLDRFLTEKFKDIYSETDKRWSGKSKW